MVLNLYKYFIEVPLYFIKILLFILFTVDLRQVKEVRIGKNSKAFEKWPDEARKYLPYECFLVLYGSTFTLKTLSCVGE